MAKVETLWLPIATLLLALSCSSSDGANILAIFPFQSRSHMIMGSALLKELASRGHQVTMISHFPEKQKIANYTDVYVKTTMIDIDPKAGSANSQFQNQDSGVLDKIAMVYNFMFRINHALCDSHLQEESVQKLINDKDLNFDLVIMEAFFNECFLGFVHKLKAPLVQVCTFGGTPWMGDWFGNPNPFAYVPDNFLPFNDKMNFLQRTVNTMVGTAFRLSREFLYLPGQDVIMKKHFGHLEGLPLISEIEHKTSLLLLNHHFSISFPRPLMPGMVQVGGLHIKPQKKLPQDLQSYLDDAPDGVVYFSLGSNLQSSQMPETTRNALLKAFSELKQKVLWKWETDSLPGQPKNVKLGKWLPQTDILAHPNVRVFITHGGLLSTQEALHRGVPVVGVPVFGDQIMNMLKAQANGLGVMLEFTNITVESVKWAVKEILDNPRYREKAQRISRIFRDQPLTPLEQAVFWTEYVIRHKGAPHLRSAALDLSWYQYFLLDVIAVLAVAAGSVLLVLYYVLRTIARRCCGRTAKDSKNISRNKKVN